MSEPALCRGGRVVTEKREPFYLDDLQIGQKFTSGSYVMDAARMKEFAAEFDPRAHV